MGAGAVTADVPVPSGTLRVEAVLVGSPPGASLVVVLGYFATPAVQQVKFVRWADGLDAVIRQVDTTKPVPVLNVEVFHRVEVAAPNEAAVPSEPVTFDSDAGNVTLTPGQPTWILALRSGARGLIQYSTSGQTFAPTPEALWTVI